MLSVQSFTFNPFQENTYIIYDDKNRCWIVDPGMMTHDENQILFDFIASKNLLPQEIINTHAHIDHILGVDSVKSKYDINFGIHIEERTVLDFGLSTAKMYDLPMAVNPANDFYIDLGLRQLGADSVQVLFTPGHSQGSISFYYEKGNWVIAGDVLFQRSIGRTDLPGGDFPTLKKSIQEQLYTLPQQTIVYSGHGAPTTIGEEMLHNPFVTA